MLVLYFATDLSVFSLVVCPWSMESHLFYFGVFNTAAGFGCIKYLM